MLAIYNESKTNWIRAMINDKTSKITTSRTLNDGKVRYLDVLLSNDIETPDMTKYVSMQNCEVLYGGNTSVKFKNKDLKPFITKSDRYNNDVVVVNLSLKGKIIKNISGANTSVLAYLVAKSELFLVMSVREVADVTTGFEITLHDSHMVADTVYTFEKKEGVYAVTTNMVQVDTVITNPTYKINHYRPARPTHAIFTNRFDSDNLTSILKYPDSHNIIVFEDGDLEDMKAYIDPMKKSGYKAVTLYVHNTNFADSNDKIYGSQYDMLKSNFKYVNILLENGKVLRK